MDDIDTSQDSVALLRELMHYGTFPEDSVYGLAVLNAAAEIERLREQLADAHDMINNMTEHLYRIHRTIQEARNDPS